MRASRATHLAGLVSAALLASACHEPITQLVVVIDSDLDEARVARVRVMVEGGEPGMLDVAMGSERSFPFSFGIRASGAQRTRIVASAIDGSGATLVSQSASAAFVAGEARRLVIQLSAACEALPSCGSGMTCRAGACAAEDVPAGDLDPVVGGSELGSLPPFAALDAGQDGGDETPPPDAGPTCSPACDDDETCGEDLACHCGSGASCGDAARCSAGMCVPWPRSCDDEAPGRGCDVVPVPGGVMTMGDRDADQEGRASALPLQMGIRVSAFRLDAYEVTVARFRRFWEAGHPSVSSVAYPGGQSVAVEDPVADPLETDEFSRPCSWTSEPGMSELHPITCITWATAMAFCAWDGGRLPTEAEFEWAARGGPIGGLAPGRAWPWGDELPSGDSSGSACDRAQAFDCIGDDAAPTRRVGSFDPAAGIYDLAGNVWELLADTYVVYQFSGDPPSPTCWEGGAQVDPVCTSGGSEHTARGGGFAGGTSSLRGASRSSVLTDGAFAPIGFRCAY